MNEKGSATFFFWAVPNCLREQQAVRSGIKGRAIIHILTNRQAKQGVGPLS
jgi:hypothetical protein